MSSAGNDYGRASAVSSAYRSKRNAARSASSENGLARDGVLTEFENPPFPGSKRITIP